MQSRNPVLVRDDVGKAKPTCYDLRDENFAYGRPDNPDFEGAREVTMQWVSHMPRSRPIDGQQDFRRINKMALTRGASNAKSLADFRRGHDVALVPPAFPVHTKVIPSDVVPAFTYGKKTRPSTPIASVVSYQFSAEYEQALDENYGQYDEEKEMRRGSCRIKTTKATQGHARASKAMRDAMESNLIVKEPFKLSKFKKVGPKMRLPGPGLNRSCSLPQIASAK